MPLNKETKPNMYCVIIVSKFNLQFHYYVHFETSTLEKGLNYLISPQPNYGLNSTTILFLQRCLKVEMTLNKEIKTRLIDRKNCNAHYFLVCTSSYFFYVLIQML